MKSLGKHTLSLIVAMGENRAIGKDNKLPWYLPADLKHFKNITSGHAIIMGRKTHESIGKPLPNRVNIVVTKNKQYFSPGCFTATSLEEAITIAEQETQTDNNEIFVIGGASIYEQALPSADRIYLTIVHHDFDGDTYFPNLKEHAWREREFEKHPTDIDNHFEYSFKMLEKVNMKAVSTADSES